MQEAVGSSPIIRFVSHEKRLQITQLFPVVRIDGRSFPRIFSRVNLLHASDGLGL
jgi:hypothetical protein